ncbi:hypothetical protein SALBM311S_12330 [Streptomyces alboniger]
MKVAKGSWNMASTRLSPISEFCRWSRPSSTYSGMRSVAYGTMRMARVSRNSRFLPGKSKRAKA